MKSLNLALTPMHCEWIAYSAIVPVTELSEVALHIYDAKALLLTLWGSDEREQGAGFCLHFIFLYPENRTLYLQCPLAESDPIYADLSHLFPVANRLQRAVYDLLGIKVAKAQDARPWLRHGAWPETFFPLRTDQSLTQVFPLESGQYAFTNVTGYGVHEIAVGPVHAGIIESGHFRFHVVGERVLRLEQRFGYNHRGIAKHFQHCALQKAGLLASRISGDSTVAYAWAFAMAVENAHHASVPARAIWLRALLLERERVINHLGDLGGLGNDGGLSIGLAHFSRLKEQLLRVNAEWFGHRYLMDVIVPGGISVDLSAPGIIVMQQEIKTLRQELRKLQLLYENHSGLQDRLITTGIISKILAEKLGVIGLVGRASGIALDWRQKIAPYTQLTWQVQTQTQGDVAARVALRFQEINESLNLLESILHQLPEGANHQTLPALEHVEMGVGCIEGWRGPVMFAVCCESDGKVRWAHAHDPSWQNWPALEHAVLGNIVPDFPLINKSFNLSYSGQDG